MTKTNIIATIGSASDSVERLELMMKAGLTIARTNMSHGDHAEHQLQIDHIKQAEKNTGKSIKLLVDLAGPKIRTGEMQSGTMLVAGSRVIITTKSCVGTADRFSVSYKKLAREVKKGDDILVSDGKRRLKVISTNGVDECICKVVVGGLITSRRGINVPGANLTIPVITSKDTSDIQFAAENHADYVALSFVRSPNDIAKCRKLVSATGSHALIIAKIETREAMLDLENIIRAADGVMVARGDLAMEIGFEHVPIAQKQILVLAKKWNKFSIVATQVLDSMEKNPNPTRAEASDIAYAIMDGADAIMLSGETAVGHYPVESIETIQKVARAVQLWGDKKFD